MPILRTIYSVLAVSAITIFDAIACAQQPPPILGSVGITEAQQVLTTVDTMMANYSQEASSATLEAALGTLVDDPGLKGLAPKCGMIAYALNDSTYAVYVETTPEMLQAYHKALTAKKLNAQTVDGMLLIVFGGTQKDLANAKKLAATAKQYLSKSGPSEIELHLDASNLIKILDPRFKNFISEYEKLLKKIERDKDVSEEDKVRLKITFGGYMLAINLLRQVQGFDLKLTTLPDSTNITYAFTTTPGSSLAKMTQMNSTVKPDLISRVPFENMVGRGVYATHTKTVVDALLDEIALVCTAMKYNGENTITKLRELNSRADEAFGDSIVYAYTLNANGDRNTYALIDLKDAAKARTLTVDICNSLNTLIKDNVTKDSTATLSFNYKDKAGKIGNTDFDTLTFSISDTQTTRDLSVISFTAKKDRLLLTTRNADLGKLIALDSDPGTSTPPLAAKSMVPPGANVLELSELNVANMIKSYAISLGQMDPDSTATQKLMKDVLNNPNLNNASPISYYTATQGYTFVGSFNVKTDLLKNILKFFSEINEKEKQLSLSSVKENESQTTPTK